MDILRAVVFGASISTVSVLIRVLSPSSSFRWSEKRAPLQPPNWVFGLVWPILYVTTGVAWVLMQHTLLADVMLGSVTGLCCLWLPVYLSLQWYILGTVILMFATGIAAAATVVSPGISSFLLAPLVAWLTFATYLNAYLLL